jgi:hypothetical protein
MPLDDALAEVRALPGDPIPPPDPTRLPDVVARIQERLATIPAEISAVLLDVAATDEGGNAAFVVRTASGWDVQAWIGTESWENPKLNYGVSVQKVWRW